MYSKGESGDANEDVSRRRLLQAAAGGTAGVLAGCSQGEQTTTTTSTTTTTTEGGGGGEEETTTTTTTKKWIDQTYRGNQGGANKLEPELAPFASGYDYGYYGILQGRGGRWCLTKNRFLWIDWDGEPELDEGEGELRFSIKDGLKWHVAGDGVIEDFSAKDVVFKNRLERAMTPESERNPKPPDVGWHADGDDTFVVDLNKAVGYNDAQLVNGYTQDYPLDFYRKGIYEGRLEAIQDASSKDERDKIRTEVTQQTADVTNKPLSGPWMVDDAAQQRLLFKLQEDHWLAEHLNWRKLEFKAITGSGNVNYAACRQDQLDKCNIPATVADDAPSFLKVSICSAGQGFGQGFIVPYASPADPVFWKDPHRAAYTRQAIAFATHKVQAAKNQLSVPSAANRPPKAKWLDRVHGFQTKSMAQSVLGDDYEQFPAYGPESRPEKAASRLRAVGFTKDGGTWYKPDGDKFTLEIISIGWTQRGVQTMVGNLSDMGIDASQVQLNGTQFVTKYWGQKEYQPIVAESMPHSGPPSSFMSYWWDPSSTIHAPGSEGRDADWTKYPVPPMGQLDAEPTEEVDVRALVEGFSTTKESELTDQIRKLSWTYAYHLPCFPMWLNALETGINTKHFDMPRPAPEFPGKWGGNYGIATGEHNCVHSLAHARQSWTRGLGGQDGKPILAKEQ